MPCRLPSLWILLSALALIGRGAKAEVRDATDQPSRGRVIAIDVLLEPGRAMVAKARAANAKLRADYPQGYTLGSEQVAHITLVHRYVHTKELPAIEAAVAKVVAAAKPLDWQLIATGYEYAIWSGVAITTIGVAPTRELSRLQEEIVRAVEPFAVTGGTAAAFCRSEELPKIDNEIVNYVEKFVPNSSGAKYNPHVTIGVAHEVVVKKLKAEPFDKFSFKPAGVAIYQLGNFGTAQKKLWEWNPREHSNKSK